MKASKIITWLIIIAVIVTIGVFGLGITGKTIDSGPGEYDALAQCLTEKSVKMYGAYWCGHCNNQKEMLGKSFKYINYIECSLPNNAGQTKVCQDAGIRAYPTWEFEDGQRIEGEASVEKLKELSGC